MFQIVLQSFVRAEVTVGIVLTILLISGKTDPQTIAFSLGGLGVFLLIQGLVPLSIRGPVRTRTAVKAAPSVIRDDKHDEPTKTPSAESPKAQPTAQQQTTTSPCACAKRPFNRREYFARAAIASLVILGTACLIYWFAPPIA